MALWTIATVIAFGTVLIDHIAKIAVALMIDFAFTAALDAVAFITMFAQPNTVALWANHLARFQWSVINYEFLS